MYCTNCGKEINENARFCGYCGYELTRNKEEAVAFNEIERKAGKNPKKITLATGLLLTLLGIRFIATLILTLDDLINALDMIMYFVIIVGILLKAKLGSVLAMGYSVFLTLIALLVPAPTSVFSQEIQYPGAYTAGAIIMNSLIFILAWKEYNDLKKLKIIKEMNYS